MSTLRDLTHYLTSLSFIERDKLDSAQVGESHLELSFCYVGNNADFKPVHLLYREYYEGVIYIEAWTQPKELILSHLLTWLSTHGEFREDGDKPTCEALENDDNSFDLMLTIPFMESVYVEEAEDGDLTLDGKRWQRCTYTPLTAEGFSLVTN